VTLEWLTTAATTSAGEPRGWKLHAVLGATKKSTLRDLNERGARAACGLRTPWGTDLFIDKKCARCLRKLGLACPKCKGNGSVGSVLDRTYDNCNDCHGTGEKDVGLTKS
jgi:hypothetical protein